MTSSILDEDIKCLTDLNNKLLLEIAAEIANKLSEKQIWKKLQFNHCF